MFKINSPIALKIIIVCALLNNSIYDIFHPNGIWRLLIVLLMNVSGVLIVAYFIKIVKKKNDINLYFKVMFLLLLIWSLLTIFRSISFNSRDLITLIGHHFAGWTWLVPLAIVFGLNITNWLNLFSFFVTAMLIVSILSIGSFYYSREVISGFISWLVFLPILLLSFFIQSKKVKNIILFSIISYLMISFYASSRINFIFIGLLIVFTFIEFLRHSNINIVKKIIIFSILIICGLLFSLKFDKFFNKLSKNEELTSDTRTFLFVELLSDMSLKERIIGRGTLGTYYSEYFDIINEQEIEGGDSATRFSSEVGYLHMILKGGYIMVILYLSILIPAAFLGIFRSKNSITRMCGYYILAYILIWTVSFSPLFGADYILLWMASGTAISSSARNITIKKVKRNYINELKFESK